MAESNNIENLNKNLWWYWYDMQLRGLFENSKKAKWYPLASYGYNYLTNYLQSNLPNWARKSSTTNNQPKDFKSVGNTMKVRSSLALSQSKDPRLKSIGELNVGINNLKTLNYFKDFNSFLEKGVTASDLLNPNYFKENMPTLDLSNGINLDGTLSSTNTFDNISGNNTSSNNLLGTSNKSALSGSSNFLNTSFNTSSYKPIPELPKLDFNTNTLSSTLNSFSNPLTLDTDFSQSISDMKFKSDLANGNKPSMSWQSGLKQGATDLASSGLGMGVLYGMNVGLNKLLGNSKAALLTSSAFSNASSLVVTNIAKTVGTNMANGASAGANVGSNLVGSLGNFGNLINTGTALGNIALDVLDPVKKSKGETAGNLIGGLGAGALATLGVPGAGWIAGLGLLLANGVGHVFGSRLLKGLKTDKDILASASTSGGTIANALKAESLSGTRYSLYNLPGAHKDEGEMGDGWRLYLALVDQVKDNKDRQNAAVGNLSIMQAEDDYNAGGAWSQRGISIGKEGMVIEELPKTTSIKLHTRIQLISPTEEFKNGGSITRIKLAKEGDVLAEKASTEPEENPIEYSRRRFPVLNNLPEINLQYDPNFNPREDLKHIGRYGDIEYIQALYDDLPYYHNYPKRDEFKGKPTIVYNDNVTNEDIALDWLSHGLRELDQTWLNYLQRLSEDEKWKDAIDESLFLWFMEDKGISPEEWRKLSDVKKRRLLKEYDKFYENEENYNSVIDGIIRGIVVDPNHRLSYGGDEEYERYFKPLSESPVWQEAYQYLMGTPEKFKEGGKVNVIPEGALHARLHHMEDDDNITKKGIPVVVEKEGGEIELLAEIERLEIIFRLEVTKKLEELQKKYDSSEYTLKEKDEFALEAGKLLVLEILYNTIDNTNSLI